MTLGRLSDPAACCLLAALLAAGAAAQPLPQVEEEELLEPAPGVDETALDEDRLKELFAEAEEVFATDPTAALPLFGYVVERIDAHVAERLGQEETAAAAGEPDEGGTAGAPEATVPEEVPPPATVEEKAAEAELQPIPEVRFLSDEARALLVRSLGYRARAQAGLGERELAEAALERMLTLDPAAGLDREQAGSTTVQLLDRVRRRLVGDLTLVVEPPDATVRLDGRPVDPTAGPVSALAGRRRLTAERLGYLPRHEEIEVAADRQTTYDLTLERKHPVLRLHTRPAGAEVRLDGVVLGVTEGTAPEGFLPHGRYSHDEFSAEWTWTDVELGLRVLEVRKAGYRPYRAELRIDELIDYPMPPIVLEPEAGEVVFQGLPEDAEILVDGAAALPENPGSSRPRITLPPGEHEIQVTAGATRMFSQSFLLADRQTIALEVRLRPGLAFLGVVGGRSQVAADLGQSLKRALGSSARWALLDRSRDAERVLTELGLTADRLIAASGLAPDRPEVGWRALQRAVDRDAPGLLYVLAAVPGDLLASEAHVLIWPAAPGPPAPDVVRLPLSEPGATTRFAGLLEQPIALERPWVGALLIDSSAAAHPVVASVTPGSPADAAGLDLGDEIVAVDQREVASAAAFDALVASAGVGGRLGLAVRTAAGPGRNVELKIGGSPRILDRAGAGALPSVTFIELSLLAEDAAAPNLWVVRLDRALLLLRAGETEEAVRELRRTSAPQSSHGVSQATVDYWLAVALMAADGSYLDAARALFERAAGFEGARLDHHDGAFLAPRARARLRELGGS